MVEPGEVSGGAAPLPTLAHLLCWLLQEVLINVAPKKANWDLRRDIADKLAKLERRTQVRGGAARLGWVGVAAAVAKLERRTQVCGGAPVRGTCNASVVPMLPRLCFAVCDGQADATRGGAAAGGGAGRGVTLRGPAGPTPDLASPAAPMLWLRFVGLPMPHLTADVPLCNCIL